MSIIVTFIIWFLFGALYQCSKHYHIFKLFDMLHNSWNVSFLRRSAPPLTSTIGMSLEQLVYKIQFVLIKFNFMERFSFQFLSIDFFLLMFT